jgi:hypothetical protein
MGAIIAPGRFDNPCRGNILVSSIRHARDHVDARQ